MFEIKAGAVYSVNENLLIHRRFVNSNSRKIPWKSDAKLGVIKLLLMTLRKRQQIMRSTIYLLINNGKCGTDTSNQ